jgi:hypothetical protein
VNDTFVREADLAATFAIAHRLDTMLLQGRVERLTALVREHGIPLPDEDPRLGASDGEHLARCRAVVDTAYRLLEATEAFERALGELRATVGSGIELLRDERWR